MAERVLGAGEKPANAAALRRRQLGNGRQVVAIEAVARTKGEGIDHPFRLRDLQPGPDRGRSLCQPRAVRPSRRQRTIAGLLDAAGVDGEVAAIETLGIGSAGLNARGDRDEDGTHHRLTLDDGRTFIYREYADTTASNARYQMKELGVFEALRDEGLPVPAVLAASRGEERAGGEPAATLLSDDGGQPLEMIFRDVAASRRPALWTEVGSQLQALHAVDPARAPILTWPVFQRPWTRFVPYFIKSLKTVVATRPDLAAATKTFTTLRKPLEEYLDSRPRVISYGNAGYLPGMLLERKGSTWTCRAWLSLGYYVTLRDPDGDLVLIDTAHREWTGAGVPAAFYKAYGGRPDPLCSLVYGAAFQLGRGASYLRHAGNVRRAGWCPPPHSTAVDALDAWPDTVEQLRSMLLR